MQRVGRLSWIFLGLALLPLSACSGQPGLLSPKEDAKNLPFNDSAHSDGISPTQAFASSSIPAGTAIVVRLQSPLSSAEARLGDQFQAVLDEPVVVQGQTVVPSGTAITGRVLAAKFSVPREPGYLRLTVSSMVLNGKAVEVHTSSVFAKGSSREPARSGARPANDVQFSTGRRLTFRLIQPLPVQG
jgi:hypothetical protein